MKPPEIKGIRKNPLRHLFSPHKTTEAMHWSFNHLLKTPLLLPAFNKSTSSQHHWGSGLLGQCRSKIEEWQLLLLERSRINISAGTGECSNKAGLLGKPEIEPNVSGSNLCPICICVTQNVEMWVSKHWWNGLLFLANPDWADKKSCKILPFFVEVTQNQPVSNNKKET